MCVILVRSGFNSKRGAGIKLRIERFSHWFSSLTSSALNFLLSNLFAMLTVDSCSSFREHDVAWLHGHGSSPENFVLS